MNKIYKVIWSKVKHQYVVVSELTHSNGKQKSSRSVSLKNSLRGILVAVLAAGSLYINGGIAFAGIDGPQNPQTGMTQQSSDNDITIIIDEDMDLKLDEELAFVFNEKEDNPEDQRETIRDQTGQINFSSTGGTEGTNKQIVISSLGSLNLATDENGKYMFKHNNDNIEEDKKYVYVDPETKEYTYADGTAVPSDERGYYQPVWKPNFTEHILDAGSDVIGNIASSEQVQKNKDGSLTLTKPGEKPGETIKQEFTNKGSLSSVAINGEYYEIPDYALQDGQVAVGETETIYDKDGESNPVEVQTGATFLKVADRNDPTKSDDVKVDGLVTYNTREDNKGNVTTDYGNITLAGYVEKDENGNIKYDEKGHPIRQGTLITNVKDGTIWKDSKDAVNGSQLYAVDQKVNAGWTAKVGETSINVRPNLENETGKDVLNFEAGDNIKLTPNADENKIKIAADGVVSYDKNTSGGYDTTSVTLGEEGNKYVPVSDDGKTPASGGVKLTNVAYASGNDKSEAVNVDYLEKYVDKNGGGSWNITANKNDENATSIGKGNTVDFSGDDNITVAKTDKADKSGADITVNLNDNITLGEGENQIQLNGAPKDDDTPAISVGNNFAVNHDGSITSTVANNAGGGAKADATFNFDEQGLKVTDNVENTSTLIDGGTITARNDKVGMDQTMVDGGTITINKPVTDAEGNVTAINTIKINGEENKATITGLTNTTWENNETWQNEHVVDNRAATEGQLQTVSKDVASLNDGAVKYWQNEDGSYDKSFVQLEGGEDGTLVTHVRDGAVNEYSSDAVNGSQLYAVQQEAGKHTTVTVNGGVEAPEDGSYTNKDGHLDGNLLLKQTNNDGQIQYDIKLNPDVNLTGEGKDSDNRVWLSGSNGTITATTKNNLPEKTTVINGGNVYVGTSVSVGANDDVVITDKDITGLSNTNWDGTTDNVSRAATEGQLQTVSKDVASLNDGAVKYWQNEDGSYDKSFVQLEGGEDGTLVTHVRDGAVNKYSSDAVNGSQLWETQQQIKDVETTANKHTIVSTTDDSNLTVKNVAKEGEADNYQVTLNDEVVLGDYFDKGNGVLISGNSGTISATNSITVGEDQGLVIDGQKKTIQGLSNTTWTGTTETPNRAATEGQLQNAYDGSVKYWRNEDGTYDKSFIQLEGGEEGTTITHLKDGVVAEYSTEAINGSQLWETQQQIKDVETTANKHTIVSTTDDSNLTVKNVAKEGEADNYQVTLNDEVVLGDYFDKGNGVLISGNSGTISATNSITVGEDQGLVIDGQKKTIQGLSNTTWTGTTETPNRAATEGQLQNAYDGSVKYWRNEDGTYDKSFIQLEGGEEGTTITHLKDGVVAEYSTEAINGSQLWETQQQIKDVETTANKHTIVSTTKDSNLTVKNVAGEGEADNYQVALKDDITLKGDDSSIELNGTKGTIQVNQETAEGTDFTNINGNVVSIGYTNSEGTQNAIVIDGGKGTITGLSNTTWDDELAKQVANSEELQGTAATQGQLQQAVSEVAEVANAGWNAKAGGNTINVKPNETLNFEGDGNITVSATGGTSNELKFGLNDNITLGDKESTSITLYTDPTSETTVVGTDGNTTNVTGYVPESYKSGTGADFVKNNGGFALFTTDTQGHGIFGVTTKGTAHGKDFVTYTKDIYGNDTRYSLNDVGDAVAQMSSYYNEENRKSYTVFSRYLNEAEKDNPFVTVDEDGNKINATRDIPLALRDDGAVLIGATIKGEDFTDNGIRINAETETTYDEDGNEVTNNIATITGLENTEWKPPTPVATFAANDGSATVTSRAATESQLNDLYNVVSVYNTFDNNGNVNYNTIKLRGDEYSYNEKNPVDSKGTSITNVAYASGKDGSEAVNVDYLNDAINNAVKDGGAISDSDRHLQEGTYHVNDQGKVELIVADEKGENQSTVTIDNIANKNDITNLDNKIDNTFNDLNDKINNIDNVETDVKGGNINEDGTISLKTENEDGTTTNVTLKGQLTDSGVVQEGTSFDKETGTITITSQDKYSGETSSVKVEGIASTEVVGATNKEDLATAYKDADKDGNATTEYITDSESMVEADVALDHAIQDVAGTSYANDMVLSNRIDSVEKRLGNVEERIDKVGAMAAAIANLRTMGFDPEAPTEIAIGVGQYKSETGIAIGVFHYPNQDFMLSASLSSSGDELMGGIGATWKLGRKSAAERAKDEEARHLEQAEEMKKLAQQEKVKAQAQRHAKLLAERQQASQKNA